MNLTIETKVQNIYFQDDDGNLGIFPLTADKRITISEAQRILFEHEIDYRIVFKVISESETLELTQEDYLKFKKEKNNQ